MRLAVKTTTSLGRSAGLILACLTLLAAPGEAAPASSAAATVRNADARAVLGEIKKPGAKGVLVNVWATWCEPCRAEMPRLLKFLRAHRAQGLRLVLVSADDEGNRDRAVSFLASQGVDFATFMKRGDDMTFIDALDPKWSGALPASFLFDGRGRLQERWYGEVTDPALRAAWDRLAARQKGKAP